MAVYEKGGFIRLQGWLSDDESKLQKVGCYACQSCQCNVNDGCQTCQSCQSCNVSC